MKKLLFKHEKSPQDIGQNKHRAGAGRGEGGFAETVRQGVVVGDVILFGSYARGEANKESDIDLVVLLKKHPISKFKEIQRMSDLIMETVLNHKPWVGIVLLSEEEWQNGTNAFYRNLKNDGITI